MRNKDEKYMEDLILGYFAKELTDEQERELLEWLNEDPSHRETLSQMADWWATAHIPLFASETKESFEKHFGHIFVSEEKKEGKIISLWKRVAAAAMVLIVVGTSFYAGKLINRENAANVVVKNMFTEVIIPMGSTSKVILPDGSLAWVNAGSTLKYNVNDNQTIREVSLTGEAYFEVVPDSLHPFIVKTENASVRVLGTSFNVKAYSEDSDLDISLITGSVNVSIHASDFAAEEINLHPNRMLRFNKETNSVNMKEIRGTDANAWIDGQLIFNEQPFPVIAHDLERKFNVSIRIESKRLEKEIFTGSFSPAYTLEQILQEVNVEKNLTWTYNENEIVIREIKKRY